MDVAASISADRRHCLRPAFQRHRFLHQSSSASRFTAGASGLLRRERQRGKDRGENSVINTSGEGSAE
jgi:hypothetical protein